MKKVLAVITTGFVPYGGLTTVMMNYWRVIDKSIYHIDFASFNNPPQSLLDEIEKEGSFYYKLPARVNIISYIRNLKNICVHYDVIHVHGNSSTSFLELFSAKMGNISNRLVHNHNSRTNHRLLNAVLHPFFKRSYTCPIACSKLAGDWLFGTGNYHILKNSIDVEKFAYKQSVRENIRKKFLIKDDNLIIGHIGKFSKQKNYPFIVDVFYELTKINNKVNLLLVGDGVLMSTIKDKVALLGLSDKVIFAGLRTDVSDMLQAMDLFLFPSLWEGLPLSILEAQASGLPVLMSDLITKEVCLTDNIYSMSLNEKAESWASFLNSIYLDNREDRSYRNIKFLTESGFNLFHSASFLENLYDRQW